MSDVKKVLTLVACGCMCLTVATSAWGQVVGAKTVTKADGLTSQCRADNNLTICNVFVDMANVGDRVFAVEADVFQVFDGFGNFPAPLFQVGEPFGADTAPNSAFFKFDSDLPCDSFVTIALKDRLEGDVTTTAPCPDPETCDWDSEAFNSSGLTDGRWFLVFADSGQGDAGADKQVLIMQASFPLGFRMDGTARVSWVALGGDGSNGTTTVTFQCLGECVPGQDCTDGDPCTGNDTCDAQGNCIGGPFVEEAPCTDGDPCTGNDTCDAQGNCIGGPFVEDAPCDDGDPCTGNDTCDAEGNCSGGPFICVEACCFPNGACGDILTPVCVEFGGGPQGAGSECASTNCATCPADLDGNGQVRVPDLITLLGAWGPCL